MTTLQPELSLPFLNLLNDRYIDWDENCIFENGKVVGFHRQTTTNSYTLRPIPKSEKALNDAKTALLILEGAMQRASSDQIAIIIKRLSLHCGMQAKAPGDVKYMFLDYCNDLKEYPAQLIETACEEYRKLPEGNSFMPSSGQLISLMNSKFKKMQFIKRRINKILGVEDKLEIRGLSLIEALDKLIVK